MWLYVSHTWRKKLICIRIIMNESMVRRSVFAPLSLIKLGYDVLSTFKCHPMTCRNSDMISIAPRGECLSALAKISTYFLVNRLTLPVSPSYRYQMALLYWKSVVMLLSTVISRHFQTEQKAALTFRSFSGRYLHCFAISAYLSKSSGAITMANSQSSITSGSDGKLLHSSKIHHQKYVVSGFFF